MLSGQSGKKDVAVLGENTDMNETNSKKFRDQSEESAGATAPVGG